MSGTNNNKNQNEPLDPRTLEQLNAYLDYELSEEERGQVRDLLRRSPAAENEIATLKATSNVLRELPAVPAPHSFALRPGMLELPTRTPRGFTLFGWRPTPTFALSLGSVAAACLLVLVLAVQLISNGGNASQQSTTAYNINSATSGTTDQANNPSFPHVSNGGGASAAATPTTAAAAAATSTTAPAAMAAASQPTAASGSSGSEGASAPSSTGSGGPTNPAPATAETTSEPSNTNIASDTTQGSSRNTSVPEASHATETSGTPLPATAKQAPTATAEPQMALNNSSNTSSNGGISASGPMPPNDTNKPGNYNPFQSKGMDYWLVIEMALAALVVVLGVGAIVAQRRNR